MNRLKILFFRTLPIIHIVFSMIWLNNLASTDAYFSVYVLLAYASFYLRIRRDSLTGAESHSGLVSVLSVAFALIVLLANYPVFTQVRDPALIGRSTNLMVNLINTLFSFIGGISVAQPILKWWFSKDVVISDSRPISEGRKWVGWAVFGSIVLCHLIHLVFVEYPGNVTEDPFTQISEMVSGTYSNFNTYWHTMLLRAVLTIGYGLTADVNGAVACFCVVQLVILSFAFAHCLMTMDNLGVPHWFWILCWAVFALIPYNMAMSITIWKDVLFAAGCLLMLSGLLRIEKHIGKSRLWNDIVFFFGSGLFIISRTNGWMIFLVLAACYLIFMHRDKRLMALMGAVSLAGWFLLNPALSMLNVSGGDLAESLSVPIQQVSRVIADGETLTEEETALLSRVVDLEEVPQLYQNWISDPMKVELRSKDYAYFQENLSEYAALWVKLGLRYPGAYVKAWVDQTKGYWNGGYDYAMYSETVTDNPYGVEKTGGGNPIASLFRLYFGLSRHVVFFEPLHSIGLHVWILLLCFARNLAGKRQEWLLSVPLVVLVLGLCFGTPVYACFRYAYPVFVCLPLILSATLFGRAES